METEAEAELGLDMETEAEAELGLDMETEAEAELGLGVEAEAGAELGLAGTAEAQGEFALGLEAQGEASAALEHQAWAQNSADAIAQVQGDASAWALVGGAAAAAAGRSLYGWAETRIGHGRDVSTLLLTISDTLLGEGLARCLRREGFRVMLAASGAQALTRYRAKGIGLFLVDLDLSDGDGLAIGRQLREALGQEVLLVAIAAASQQERDRCLAGGFDACLERPGLTEDAMRGFVRDLQIFLAGPAPDDTAMAVAAGAAATGWGPIWTGANARCVLLLAPEAYLRAGLSRILTEEGVSVLPEADPDRLAAIARDRAASVGAILIDMAALERVGLALAAELRALPGMQGMLVALVDVASPERIAACAAAGFVFCLERPKATASSLRTCAKALRELLTRPPPSRKER